MATQTSTRSITTSGTSRSGSLRSAKQIELFNAAVYGLPWLQPLNEYEAKYDLPFLGFSGIDAIGRRAGQCFAVEWIVQILPPLLRERFVPGPFPPDPLGSSLAIFDGALEHVFGGVVREILARKEERALSQEEVGELMERGAARGLEEFARFTGERLRSAEEALALLSGPWGIQGKAGTQ